MFCHTGSSVCGSEGVKCANGRSRPLHFLFTSSSLPLLSNKTVSKLTPWFFFLPNVRSGAPQGVHRLLLLHKHKHSCVAINRGVTPDLRPGPLSRAGGAITDRWQRHRPRIPPPSPRLHSASPALRAPTSHRLVLTRRRPLIFSPRSQMDGSSTPLSALPCPHK